MTPPPAVLARLIADIDATETVPVNSHPDCNYFCKLVDIDTWNELRDTIRACLAQQGEAVGTYAHAVPDKCERITWRGHYYHLTFHSRPIPAAVAVDEAMVERACEAFGSGNLTQYGRDRMRDAITAALQPAATSEGENNG